MKGQALISITFTRKEANSFDFCILSAGEFASR